MSVLIKGMEMPKDCPYCPLAHWNLKNEFTGCEIVKKYFSTEEMYADGRPDFCPLVELPPHGRLIDADKLKEEFPHDEDWDYPVNTNSYVVETIDKSPTIIEAEEEE